MLLKIGVCPTKVKGVLDNDESFIELLDDIKSDNGQEKKLEEYLMKKDVYQRSASILDDISFPKQIESWKKILWVLEQEKT